MLAVGTIAEGQEQTCTLKPRLLEEVGNPSDLFFAPSDAVPLDTLFAHVKAQTFRWSKSRRWTNRRGRAKFNEVVETPPPYVSAEPLEAVVRLGDHDYGFALDRSRAKGDYDRLYFDRDRDGDLTDEAPLAAEPMQRSVGFFFGSEEPQTLTRDGRRWEFPLVELPLEVDGTSTPYAFRFTLRGYVLGGTKRVTASLAAAMCRSGSLELGGQPHLFVLVDYNSNGRYDDRLADDKYRGDALFIDPSKEDAWTILLERSNRQYLTDLLCIGGAFYEPGYTAGGESLTLAPTTLPMGQLRLGTTPWTAKVSSDHGVFEIGAPAEGTAEVPAGEWRLLSYTIDHTGIPWKEQQEAEEEQADGDGEDDRPRTYVSANVPKDLGTLEVPAGGTLELPFGPPYRALVRAHPKKRGKVDLRLDLKDRGGASCAGLRVEGDRPPSPSFRIFDPGGKLVHKGEFEYG